MFSKLFQKRIISAITAFIMLFSPVISANALDAEKIKDKDERSLGFSIINGYSKLSTKKSLTSYEKSAVFASPDLSNPYHLMLAGVFFVANAVNLDRIITDNSYTMELVEKLNGFLTSAGVKNEKSETMKSKLKSDGITVAKAYETLGIYIINSDKSYSEELMKNENADFVLADARVPMSMKDLNMDGKSDPSDAIYIQKYLAGDLVSDDSDENEYIKYACDINKDKKHDINDVSDLLKQK